MEERFGQMADGLLASQGIITDDESRRVLIREIERALTQAAKKLELNAEGDYRPDPDANRFPPWRGDAQAASSNGGAKTIKEVFEGWKLEAKAAELTQKTIKEYQSVITRFIDLLGHDDAQLVSPADVVRWKDKRLADGRAAKTVKDVDLSALKSVFGWAERNHILPSNPAKGITLKVGKRSQQRPKGFTDEEAAAVLSAAIGYLPSSKEHPRTSAAKRWAPWLCAYTGARIGEVAQLRRQDVRRDGAHWIMTITPEAGPVKNKERREVPLHPHLVELGFPAFVLGQPPGYLFVSVGRGSDVLGPLQAVKNRVSEFVRTIVPDKRVAPNHGWRHRFKTVGFDVGIPERVLDAICGHSAKTVGQRYGDVTLRARTDAVGRLPRYEVNKP